MDREGIYVGRGPRWGSMLGTAREGALCCASPGMGLYVGHDPGGGSKLGMAQEGALNWARPGRGF